MLSWKRRRKFCSRISTACLRSSSLSSSRILSAFIDFSRFLWPRLSYRPVLSSRHTSLVGSGSLPPASRNASCAVAFGTPSISNRILPGRITATHCSGAPLPLPIRVSAGFLVIGLSGNRRIQTLTPRLMKRVMAMRAASICRSVIHPQRMAFNPKSPNASEEPRQALPVIRPRCCFLYLTFLGINMAMYLRYPSLVGSELGPVAGAPFDSLTVLLVSCFQLGCGGASGGRIGATRGVVPVSGGGCTTGPVGSGVGGAKALPGRLSRRSRNGWRRGSGSLRSESRRPLSRISPLYVQHLTP